VIVDAGRRPFDVQVSQGGSHPTEGTDMRFMLMLKGDPGNPHDAQAGEATQPDNELVSAMTRFNDELVSAGVLVAAEGLLPSGVSGRRVAYQRGRRKVLDGPFAEAKELIAGFYILELPSMDDAVAWAQRCPVEYACPGDEEAVIEIRQIATLDDIDGISEENRAAERELREKLVGG
jgi:hypothetical protein